MPHKTFTREEVAKNNTEDSLWFIIDSKVYDVADFIDAHPGGEAVLKQGKVLFPYCKFYFFSWEIRAKELELGWFLWVYVLGAKAAPSEAPVLAVLTLRAVAGTDTTSAFYNLHRQEVLQKYSDLCIGQIEGEEPKVIEQKPGDLSVVPYGEPTWLT
jgi:cytochrome b involved in lipid metabolism